MFPSSSLWKQVNNWLAGGTARPRCPLEPVKPYWKSTSGVDFKVASLATSAQSTVGILYNFIKLHSDPMWWSNAHEAISGKLVLEVGWHRAGWESKGSWSFEVLSDIKSPITGGGDPRITASLGSGDVGTWPRVNQSACQSLWGWNSTCKLAGGKTMECWRWTDGLSHIERICFHHKMKLFGALQGNGGTAAAK